jgi:hypothetical protein
MDGRTVLLGDWNPVVRDPTDIVRLSFLAGALAFALAGRDGALVLGLAGVFVVAVPFLNLPRLYDLSIVVALALAAWGEVLRAYDHFPAYDVVTHVLVPLLGAPAIYIGLARLDVLPDPASETERHHHVGIADGAGALIGGLPLAAWAVFGWGSVRRIPGENRAEDPNA